MLIAVSLDTATFLDKSHWWTWRRMPGREWKRDYDPWERKLMQTSTGALFIFNSHAVPVSAKCCQKVPTCFFLSPSLFIYLFVILVLVGFWAVMDLPVFAWGCRRPWLCAVVPLVSLQPHPGASKLCTSIPQELIHFLFVMLLIYCDVFLYVHIYICMCTCRYVYMNPKQASSLCMIFYFNYDNEKHPFSPASSKYCSCTSQKVHQANKFFILFPTTSEILWECQPLPSVLSLVWSLHFTIGGGFWTRESVGKTLWQSHWGGQCLGWLSSGSPSWGLFLKSEICSTPPACSLWCSTQHRVPSLPPHGVGK